VSARANQIAFDAFHGELIIVPALHFVLTPAVALDTNLSEVLRYRLNRSYKKHFKKGFLHFVGSVVAIFPPNVLTFSSLSTRPCEDLVPRLHALLTA